MQFYSTNPRNSAINIRGLGAPFGLTNDGLEPGVGLYIDGVFYARPASATLDFLDVDQVEVLRGPQGTLFGKNTTAGAINVTTRKPSFTPGTEFELNYGNLQFVQAKASITGPLGEKLAGRAVVLRHAARRHGLQRQDCSRRRERPQQPRRPRPAAVRAVGRARDHAGARRHAAARRTATRRSSPASRRRCARRTGSTRQIAADLNYAPPSFNAFDRLTDIDTPLRSNQDLGGAVAERRLEARAGPADVDDRVALLELGSVERPRLHRPAGHDDLGRAVEAAAVDAGGPLRRATCRAALNFVVGAFAFRQTIDSDPAFKQEQGSAAARFLLAPSANGVDARPARRLRLQPVPSSTATPARRCSASSQWSVTDRLRLLPGLRLQLRPEGRRLRPAGLRRPADDRSRADRAAAVGPRAAGVHGGRRRHQPVGSDHRWPTRSPSSVNAYATYATGFKSVGLNLNGLPTDALNRPVLSAATVKPEDVHNFEVGVKTDAASAASPRTSPSSTPRSRTSRRR